MMRAFEPGEAPSCSAAHARALVFLVLVAVSVCGRCLLLQWKLNVAASHGGGDEDAPQQARPGQQLAVEAVIAEQLSGASGALAECFKRGKLSVAQHKVRVKVAPDRLRVFAVAELCQSCDLRLVPPRLLRRGVEVVVAYEVDKGQALFQSSFLLASSRRVLLPLTLVVFAARQLQKPVRESVRK